MLNLTSFVRPIRRFDNRVVRPNAFLVCKAIVCQRSCKFSKDTREIVCAAAVQAKSAHPEPRTLPTDATKKKAVQAEHSVKLPILSHTTELFDVEKVPPEVASRVLRQIETVSETNAQTLQQEILPDIPLRKENDVHVQVLDPRNLPQYYMKLSKIRLTGLVVITTLAGYGIAPAALDPQVLMMTILGTGLMSCAANATNQFLEIPYDSQMSRTKNRVLVRGHLTPLHAITFAAVTSTCGLSTLYFGVNGLTAALGLANLFLYTSVYTPMKRYSIFNTWVGSVVGAIPPVMGWTACTGALEPGALFLGLLLFSWQFPHFNALSWNLRPDYSRAGYRMMSVTDPDLCRRTTLRHSVVILTCCSMAPFVGLSGSFFAVASFPLNAYLVIQSWRFYRDSDSGSSRRLFRFSLIHIPLLLTLMFVSKHIGDIPKMTTT